MPTSNDDVSTNKNISSFNEENYVIVIIINLLINYLRRKEQKKGIANLTFDSDDFEVEMLDDVNFKGEQMEKTWILSCLLITHATLTRHKIYLIHNVHKSRIPTQEAP